MRATLRSRPWMLVSAAWIAISGFAILSTLTWRFFEARPIGPVHELLYAPNGGALYIVCALFAPAIFVCSRRWPIRPPRVGARIAFHIVLALAFWAVIAVCYHGVLAALVRPEFTAFYLDGGLAHAVRRQGAMVLAWTLLAFPIGAVLYFSAVGFDHMLRYVIEARERSLQVARLSQQFTAARFAALQAQLRPHFVFNTLNTIAVRARDGDSAGTARMVELLSELLRQTLSTSQANELPLSVEMDLVRRYLAIEEARFSDRLNVTLALDPGTARAAVPSFAVQHLVENAIRHGVAKRRGMARVEVAARRDGGILEVCVRDDGVGFDDSDTLPSGHGLENTRERLRAMYGDPATLRIESSPATGTTATLRVPYRVFAPAQSTADV